MAIRNFDINKFLQYGVYSSALEKHCKICEKCKDKSLYDLSKLWDEYYYSEDVNKIFDLYCDEAFNDYIKYRDYVYGPEEAKLSQRVEKVRFN